MSPSDQQRLLADVDAFCQELREHEELCYVERRFNDRLIPLAKKHNLTTSRACPGGCVFSTVSFPWRKNTTSWACPCQRHTAAAAPMPSSTPRRSPGSARKAPAFALFSP